MGATRIVMAVVVVVAALALLWVRGMRDKRSRVVRFQRRLNRDHMNPRQRTAGAAGSTTALVRHTGRRSGRAFETPVDAIPTADGFVVAMVYGPDTDWVRNLLAGGPATVVHDGTEHTVLGAEVVPFDKVAGAFAGQVRLMKVFGVREVVAVRTRTA